MRWSQASKLSNNAFRRLTGVKMKTFDVMVGIITEAYALKHLLGGRPHSLCIQDMILMMLEYYREYRTYFHIGASYGLSESNAFQTIRWVEEKLVESNVFSLPPKQDLMSDKYKGKKVVIDATESPIERPKKNSAYTIQAKKSDIHTKLNCL